MAGAVATDLDEFPLLKAVSAGGLVVLLLAGAIFLGRVGLSILRTREYRHPSGYSARGMKAIPFGALFLVVGILALAGCGALLWIVWG